jgi:hypothetical protein
MDWTDVTWSKHGPDLSLTITVGDWVPTDAQAESICEKVAEAVKLGMSAKVIPGWPTVLPNDSGIRPAGPPDECFYCRGKVGEPHGTECVCVSKRVRYEVYLDETPAGFFEHDDPYFWTDADCEFHKNESTWCKDNALDGIEWLTDEHKSRAQIAQAEHGCLCGPLEFRFLAVMVPGPFRETW